MASVMAAGQVAQPPVAAVPQQQTMMQVVVPAGMQAGQQFMVQAGAAQMQVVVPPGVTAGQSIQVQVPAAPVGVFQTQIVPTGHQQLYNKDMILDEK